MLKARQAVLAVVGVVFTCIAVASLVVPHVMAEGLGYRLDNVDALSEFRAIYVGLWLAHAVIMFGAARRPDTVLADVAGVLVAGQVVGRVFSLTLDGVPDKLIPISMVEALGAALILGLRPVRRSPPKGGPGVI
jgi:hypothetical protein